MTEQAVQEITIELNGKSASVPLGVSITEFLASKGLQDRLVVVELNGRIVPRTEFATTRFAEGDRVEVVHFVGGG